MATVRSHRLGKCGEVESLLLLCSHNFSSSENQFVVPPLGGRVECRPIPLRQTLPPKGGTTNCDFHSFRASPREKMYPSKVVDIVGKRLSKTLEYCPIPFVTCRPAVRPGL